jgi:hypothetical protein
MRDLFAIPIIGALCLSGFALCFVATAFDAVFVLFCYTPIESGGLSFNVRLFCLTELLTVINLLTFPDIPNWICTCHSGIFFDSYSTHYFSESPPKVPKCKVIQLFHVLMADHIRCDTNITFHDRIWRVWRPFTEEAWISVDRDCGIDVVVAIRMFGLLVSPALVCCRRPGSDRRWMIQS